ncbi:MAG: T9SS type A sorting domain-containing protein [Saprospiraceae bacterium]|nr:T9SS type A sorting domain-containing protein [Saprospiraceae bacterium]
MTCTFGVKYWHIIHTPDNKGLDCNLEQHYPIPTYHGFSPPNFPHFRLFDAEGSPCDTLGINGPPPPEDTTPPPPQCAGNIRIYPNPAQRLAQIELPDCEGGSLRVFDAMGRWVEDLALAPERVGTELDVSRYVPGIYFLHIRTATGEAVVRGLAVVR